MSNTYYPLETTSNEEIEAATAHFESDSETTGVPEIDSLRDHPIPETGRDLEAAQAVMDAGQAVTCLKDYESGLKLLGPWHLVYQKLFSDTAVNQFKGPAAIAEYAKSKTTTAWVTLNAAVLLPTQEDEPRPLRYTITRANYKWLKEQLAVQENIQIFTTGT